MLALRFLLDVPVKMWKRQLPTSIWEGNPARHVPGRSGDAERENSHYLDTGRL